MSFSLVHFSTSNSTHFDLKQNDLVLMTKTGCEALSNELSVEGVISPNGRGVMNSGNSYTTYTCRNFAIAPSDIDAATINTPSTGYTSYYLLVFRPEPGFKFTGEIETDVIDAEIYPGSTSYSFNSNEAPVLCFVGLTKGWAPSTTSTVSGGTEIDIRADYTIDQPEISMVASLSSGQSYERWGSVGLSFPLFRSIQAQGQIVG